MYFLNLMHEQMSSWTEKRRRLKAPEKTAKGHKNLTPCFQGLSPLISYY